MKNKQLVTAAVTSALLAGMAQTSVTRLISVATSLWSLTTASEVSLSPMKMRPFRAAWMRHLTLVFT